MATEMEKTVRTVDPAAAFMLEQVKIKGIETAYDRYLAQQPQCKFGLTGVCCRICIQGPCRVIPSKAGADRGICGADAYTIVARNAVRMMAGGASAHSDHGREIAFCLKNLTEGHAPDYKLTDLKKLNAVAIKVGIATEGREANDIARDIALKALQDFGKYDSDPTTWLWANISEERKQKFMDTGVVPTAIDRAVVQLMHQTHIGVDADPINIIFGGIKAALADFTGSSLATDITDILFGTPVPIVTEANMGVLKEEMVNLAVHGHNPLLSEQIVFAARELEAEAKAAGASGVNVVGICCTGNEVLMREGVPTVTNFASQELVIATGVLDAMVVDVQCIMPGLKTVANCYHTSIITTSKIAKIPGSVHVNFHEHTAKADAYTVVREAIASFKKRDKALCCIPNFKKTIIAGFSFESLMDVFAAVNPEKPIQVLADAILAGEIKGVTSFIGCNNQKVVHDSADLEVVKAMAANDVLVLCTGCSAQAFAKYGVLSPEGVEEFAGEGYKKFIRRLEAANKGKLTEKLPLAFHMGSCVDNSRLAEVWYALAEALGCSSAEVPFVGIAAEAMSEKAVAIGTYFISQGIPAYVGVMPPVNGSDLVYQVCTRIARDVFGGYFILETDPKKGIARTLEALENRVWRLKVHQKAAEKYGSAPMHSFEAP